MECGNSRITKYARAQPETFFVYHLEGPNGSLEVNGEMTEEGICKYLTEFGCPEGEIGRLIGHARENPQ